MNIEKMRIVGAVTSVAFYARGTAGPAFREKANTIVVATTASGADDALSAD